MTKIAFGCDSLAVLERRLAARGGPEAVLTTRYLPKRHAEMAGGSLYWIIAHRLVARSPILRFEPADDGRTQIVIAAQAIPVASVPRRAHQGWRYLHGDDAPPDLAGADAAGGDPAATMPGSMLGELTRLGLV